MLHRAKVGGLQQELWFVISLRNVRYSSATPVGSRDGRGQIPNLGVETREIYGDAACIQPVPGGHGELLAFEVGFERFRIVETQHADAAQCTQVGNLRG